MWLFTPSGFLSIVADQQHPGARARPRPRPRGPLGERTGAPAPTETPERDYRFRTRVRFAVLAADLAQQAGTIDYPNFKAEVASPQGYDRARRYGRIWSVTHELQETTP